MGTLIQSGKSWQRINGSTLYKNPMFHGVLCVTNSGNWGTEIDCQYGFFLRHVEYVWDYVSVFRHIKPYPAGPPCPGHHLTSFDLLKICLAQTKFSMNKRKVEMNVVDYIFVFVSEGCFAKWIPKNSGKKPDRRMWVKRPGFQVPSQAPQLRHCVEAILQSSHPAFRRGTRRHFLPRGTGFFLEAGKHQVSGPLSDTKPSRHFPGMSNGQLVFGCKLRYRSARMNLLKSPKLDVLPSSTTFITEGFCWGPCSINNEDPRANRGTELVLTVPDHLGDASRDGTWHEGHHWNEPNWTTTRTTTTQRYTTMTTRRRRRRSSQEKLEVVWQTCSFNPSARFSHLNHSRSILASGILWQTMLRPASPKASLGKHHSEGQEFVASTRDETRDHTGLQWFVVVPCQGKDLELQMICPSTQDSTRLTWKLMEEFSTQQNCVHFSTHSGSALLSSGFASAQEIPFRNLAYE